MFGREFELLEYNRSWGEHRVFYRDSRGKLRSLPANWTNVVADDPFVVVAAGRSRVRVADLLKLAELVARRRGSDEEQDPGRHV